MRVISLDCETYWDRDYTLSKMTTESYIRDPRFELIGISVSVDSKTPVWLEEPQWRAFARSVDWSQVCASAHHANFDGLILAHHYGAYPARWLDTLSMSRAIHGSRIGNSLEALLVHYGLKPKGDYVQHAKGKHRADFTPEEYAAYGAYSNNDNAGHQQLLRIFLPQFPRDELDLIDTTIKCFTEPSFVLDEPKLAEYLGWEVARKQQLLAELSMDKSTLMSNEKFAEALRVLGVEPPLKHNKNGDLIYAFAKTDPGMQELLEDSDDDVRLLAEARVAIKSTLNETRTARLLKMGAGGRPCPVYYKYAAAQTLRWGGGDKMNWQNLERTNKKNPRKGVIRKCIKAPAGYKIVVADLSQVEARFTAWLAGHQALVRDFREGVDVYSSFASKAYGRRVDRKNVAEDEIPGHVGKTCVLGLGFGMGWLKFAGEMLKGAQGGPPVQFTREDINKLGIDPQRFLANPENIERIKQMPSRLGVTDRLVHCTVANHFVEVYRRENAPIKDLWKFADHVLERMYTKRYGIVFYLGILNIVEEGLQMPSGMILRYPHMQKDAGGGYSYLSGKNTRTHLYGAKLIENIVQALCRNIAGHAVLRLKREYLDPVLGRHGRIAGLTHDEAVPVVPESAAPECFARLIQIMKEPPEWAPGLPLNAEGGFGDVYGEIK